MAQSRKTLILSTTLFLGGVFVIAFLLIALPQRAAQVTNPQDPMKSSVLGTTTSANPLMVVNIPAYFKNLLKSAELLVEGKATVLGDLDVSGKVNFDQDVVIRGALTLTKNITGNNVNIDLKTGKITAANIIYSVTAGSGIGVSGTQDITIENTDKGSTQNIFKKIKVGDDTIEADSNTDQVTFLAGNNVSLSRSGKEITFTALGGGWAQTSGIVSLQTASDSVGIGTASPQSKLEINSGTSGVSGLRFTNLTSGSTSGVGGGKVLSLNSGGEVILVADQTGDNSTPSAEAVLPSGSTGSTLYFNGTTWVASTNLYHNGGSVGISNANPQAREHINTNSASVIGLIVQGYTSQSANLQEWRDVNGNPLSYIDAAGAFNGSFSGNMNGTVTGTLNPGLTQGSVVFQGASGLTGDAANFFWDNSTKKLGIGTNGPGKALDINSSTGANLRLTYNDLDGSATNYADFSTTSGGNLTIAPSGGLVDITGDLRTSNGGHVNTSFIQDYGSSGPYINMASSSVNIGQRTASNTILILTGVTSQSGDYFQANSVGGSSGNIFKINSSGSVGIGDNSPDALLDLDSAATTTDISGILATALTTGTQFKVANTSTALSTGKLATFDWSPGSATTATSDLFNINIGTNGTTTGNLFSISDTGSNLFSVSESGITNSIPVAFNAPGDVVMAYDLQFSNQTASSIKALGPLTLDAGESYESNDLTLKTYNSGRVIFDTSALGGVGISSNSGGTVHNGLLSLNGAATGKALAIFNQTGDQDIFAASTSGTSKFVISNTGNVGIGSSAPTSKLQLVDSKDVSSGSYSSTSLASTFTGSALVANSVSGLSNTVTVNASGDLGSSRAVTGTDANVIYGSGSSASSANSTIQGMRAVAYNDGVSMTLGTTKGIYALSGTSRSTATATNAYGVDSQLQATGTIGTGYIYHATDKSGAGAMTTQYGLYVDSLAGATTNYAVYTAGTTQSYFGGNVGINDTTPDALFDIDSAATTTDVSGILATALTTGTQFKVANTSTALTTGKLASFDWSPGSATTATGDLFNINIGTNGTTTGNIFSVSDTASNLFTVSESAITANVPVAMNAPGDVGIAYDLAFTNETASFIKASAPLYLDVGESFESNDLTLRTYNNGRIVLDNGTTGGIGSFGFDAIAGTGGSFFTLNPTLTAMNGSDTVRLLNINPTNANHTSTVNALYGIDIQAITGDAEATETAINIGSGWDYALTTVGDAGFGTATPVARVDVADNRASGYAARFFNDGNNINRSGILVKAGEYSSSATTNTLVDFQDGDGTAVGSITFNTVTTSYNTTSDQRVKTNISDSAFNLDTIKNIQIHDFNWKGFENLTKSTGVLAQELYQVYPQAVTVPSDPAKLWSVDYSKLVPLTIKGIQDQQKQISTLSEILNATSSASFDTAWRITTEGRLQNLELATSRLATVSGKIGSNSISWTETLVEFFTQVVFHAKATFEKEVTYLADVFFGGRVTFGDKDMGGYALIHTGDDQVHVAFEKPFNQVPVISVTSNDSILTYDVTDKSVSGFTIRLIGPAASETSLSWIALPIKDAKVVESGFLNDATASATLNASGSALPVATGSGQVAGTATSSANVQ